MSVTMSFIISSTYLCDLSLALLEQLHYPLRPDVSIITSFIISSTYLCELPLALLEVSVIVDVALQPGILRYPPQLGRLRHRRVLCFWHVPVM